MRGLQVHGFDGLSSWQLAESPAPEPDAGEVQVRVEANAISYVDLLMARGRYQVKPAPPFVPGTEFCGVVTQCGTGVPDTLRPGTRVTGTVFGGAWAEVVCAPAPAVCPVAVDADAGEAAALPVTFATAVYALHERARLRAGERVFVLGAAGGVGLAAVQSAKALGAWVVGGATGAAKCAAAREAGADEMVDMAAPDWAAQVKALSDGGVDVVLDPVGGRATDPAFRTLRWGGRHLVVGFAEGAIAELRTNLPLLKGASLVGVDVRQFREREPEAHRANLALTVDLFARGLLRPLVAARVPAADWPRAIAAAEDRLTMGRVVIDWTAAFTGPETNTP